MTAHRRNLHWRELVENKEEVRLVWLDADINDTHDSIQIQTTLLELNPAAQFYTDPGRCIDLIKSIKDEQVLFVVSNGLARNVLQLIHHFRSIIGVFIFCTDHQHLEICVDDYKKSTKQFIDQNSLFESISQTINHCGKQRIAFSLFDQKQNSLRNLSRDSGSFLWHQVLLHVLKQMPQDEQSKQDMLDICRDYYKFDKTQLKQIEELQENYNPNEAIGWYTKDCFVYRLLNRALRTENTELLHLFRFFIIDLCSEIENAKMNNSDSLTLYRGQIIPVEELEILKQHVGSIISINGFFSTSRDIDVARSFTNQINTSVDYPSVLFEICADSTVKTVVFADVSGRSPMRDEQEILFTLNSLFKILSVKLDPQLKIWKIKLITTDQGTKQVDQYITSVQQQIDEYSPTIYFGRLLLHELAQTDRAEKYFNMLLKSRLSDPSTIASVHNWIGVVHHKRRELSLALEKYKLAQDIRKGNLPIDHPHHAHSYYDLGSIAEERGEYIAAINYYEKAVNIYERSYNGDHVHKAEAIKKMGITYKKKGDISSALQYLSHALEMFQRILPAQHPLIAMCLREMGYVYFAQNDFDKALECFYQKLEMDEQSLPSEHPYHSGNLHCIVKVYEMKGDTAMASTFCEQKIVDQRNNLGENHPRIAQTLMIMAKLLENEDSRKALTYYIEALSILEQSTLVDPQTISNCLKFINHLCLKYCMHEDRVQCFLKVLNLYRRTLPCDHVDIANICKKTASCYQDMKNPSKALQYWNESYLIYQVNYGPDHNMVKSIRINIEKLNKNQKTTVRVKSVRTSVTEEQGVSTSSHSDSLSVEQKSPIADSDAIS